MQWKSVENIVEQSQVASSAQSLKSGAHLMVQKFPFGVLCVSQALGRMPWQSALVTQ